MKQSVFFLAFTLIVSTGCTQGVPTENLINGAVQAAPANLRDGATVKGYNDEGELITLREGTNILICLADDPNKDGFNAACYHKDLEPFMARSRELRAEGKSNGEIFSIKEEEVKSGLLKMPEVPTTLHILSGSDGVYDEASGKVLNANYRYVVYIPFATEETTGLPLKPVVGGGPWLMDPGTHRAHIMISTPAKK